MWKVFEVARTGRVIRIALDRHENIPTEPWGDAPVTALGHPIVSASQDRIVAGLSPRLRLTEQYRNFFELVARQLGASIDSVNAYETARKRAEMLADLKRAKSTFFSDISHEFRTPLTLIIGPLQESLEDLDCPSEGRQRERIDIARRNAERLRRLANTLLDFARLKPGV